MFSITIPTELVEMRYKGKPVSLTYNKWIRYPYMTRYKANIAFKASLQKHVPKQFTRPVKLKFCLLVRSASKTRDLHGFCAVPDKLFCDWLVDKEGIPDDSLKYIHQSVYAWEIVPNLKKPLLRITVEEI